MNPAGHCAYPPCLAAGVETAPHSPSDPPRWVAGSAIVGRYLLLGPAEMAVLNLLHGPRTLADLSRDSGHALPSLVRFLSKLDDTGLLAGERSLRHSEPLPPIGSAYLRWSLFNPDRLFARLLPALRFIWTPTFFACSLLLFTAAAFVVLSRWPELSQAAAIALRQHYLAIFVLAWAVTVTHEFAHGLTAKAFGGRATEVGALLIYYCLPALYCNVSGLHLIPGRGRRLWVIAAGVYWQLIAGASALIVWSIATPGTLLAAAAMALTLASLLDVFFNANPLIKLDGYYFLSLWLGIPNLMDRSRACWSALLWGGEPARAASHERRSLLCFGFLSFFFNLALPTVLLWYAAQYLMDWFAFPGLLACGAIAARLAWDPLKKIIANREKRMKSQTVQHKINWRRFAPWAVALAAIAFLCLPWTASVGAYGGLVTIPGRESIVRAPESGSLVDLHVAPGAHVAAGAKIGAMANLDLDEQLAQVRADLARARGESDRLTGEQQVRQAAIASMEWQLDSRRREFSEYDAEQRQIRAAAPSSGPFVLAASTAPTTPALPAALAALQSEAGRAAARAAENTRQLDRSRNLLREGILSRRDLDAAQADAAASSAELQSARDRLRAALIEHRRKRDNAESEMNIARGNLAAGRAQIANLEMQLQAAHRLATALEARLQVLEQKRTQFTLSAPLPGVIFGEDLNRSLGQFFSKGAEICRVADTRELIVRIQVSEQTLGDISIGQPVRVKTRALPDHIFRGQVSKIAAEAELDSTGLRTYRVELITQNPGGLLRPGMTVFARIDFGRHAIGWLALHKLKQNLRPEMWML